MLLLLNFATLYLTICPIITCFSMRTDEYGTANKINGMWPWPVITYYRYNPSGYFRRNVVDDDK